MPNHSGILAQLFSLEVPNLIVRGVFPGGVKTQDFPEGLRLQHRRDYSESLSEETNGTFEDGDFLDGPELEFVVLFERGNDVVDEIDVVVEGGSLGFLLRVPLLDLQVSLKLLLVVDCVFVDVFDHFDELLFERKHLHVVGLHHDCQQMLEDLDLLVRLEDFRHLKRLREYLRREDFRLILFQAAPHHDAVVFLQLLGFLLIRLIHYILTKKN